MRLLRQVDEARTTAGAIVLDDDPLAADGPAQQQLVAAAPGRAVAGRCDAPVARVVQVIAVLVDEEPTA